MNQIELLSKLYTAQQAMFSAVVDMLNEWGEINFNSTAIGCRLSFSNNDYVRPIKITKTAIDDVKLSYYIGIHNECKEINFYSLTATDIIRLITFFQLSKKKY